MVRPQQMEYDRELQRWRVTQSGNDYGLHCGEHFSIVINGKPVPCRIELDRSWYVIMNGAKFNLRETDHYSVIL